MHSHENAVSVLQVRVKSTALDGARLRAVDRVPHALKIVGRMPPEALAKFLVDLGSSRSRQKTVVRFELPEDGVRDAKAYNRLVEVTMSFALDMRERSHVLGFCQRTRDILPFADCTHLGVRSMSRKTGWASSICRKGMSSCT